jgi:signal transduction histidine kinase
LADRGDVALVVSDDGSPTTIDADPVRLDEVLTNLLTNAIQHTPAGGRVDVTVGSSPNGGVTFTLDDSGAGIPADQLPIVFERFVTTADTGGTGLGLAIARRLVEAHDGTIDAAAAPAGGTRIRFRLP